MQLTQRVVIEDGLNASVEKTGIGSYTRRLIASLEKFPSEFDIVFVECKVASLIRNYYVRRIVYRLWKNFLFELLHLRRGDILHITSFRSSVVRRRGVIRIYTIHDLVAKNYQRCLPKRARKSGAAVVDRAVGLADLIIVPNHFIRDELLSTYENDVRKKMVHVVTYSALADQEHSDKKLIAPAQPHDFFLSVGTIEVRKNLNSLIRAFELFCADPSYPDTKLIIVGKPGYGAERVFELIAASSSRNRIEYRDFVCNDELFLLFESARALVYPSLYEGFGLPALEAAMSGKTIIASDIGTFRAIGRDYFDFYGRPEDHESLAEALLNCCAGKLYPKNVSGMAALYTQDRVARSHLKVYRSVGL